MNRSERKTKKLIYKSFLSLAKKKEVHQITIQEIADQADVSRGTIYFHFEDKYNLLDTLCTDYLSRLFKICADIDEDEEQYFKKIISNMFYFLDEHSEEYTMFFINHEFVQFKDSFIEMLNGAFQQSSKEERQLLTIQFLSSGVVGTIEWWLKHKQTITATQATDELCSFLDMHHLLDSFAP